jgi:hypothetical protein
MTREEFLHQLAFIDYEGDDIPFSNEAQRLADYDADRRVLIKEQRAEIERLKDLIEHLKIEAQGHAQEARAANSTIAEIYQCVIGSTGEPGNWHGAQPVRDEIDLLNRREDCVS